MEDEGLPWSSPKKVSDRFAKNGEDMLEVLVNDIDRYEQLSNREELLALASALAGRGVILEEVPLDHVDSVVNLEQCDAAIHVQNPEDLLQNNSNEVNDGRYKAVTISDTEQFILANRNANTRTKTKSDLKMFYEWALSNGEMRMVEDVPFPELDGLLARFYLGVRRRDGEEYEPDTLSGVQNSIDRHLKDLKINVDIKKHEAFSHSRRVLEAKRKDLKSQGKGNKKNRAEPLDSDEIQKLYEKQILGAANPNALLNTVWLNNGVHYGFRGRQEHTNLRLGDLKLLKDGSGTEYVEFYERTTKTRTGAKSGDVRDVTPKMFAQPDSDYCPVKLFKLYVSKRPEDLRSDPESRFYLRPLPNPDKDGVWYCRQPLGKNKLGMMMKTMAETAELYGRKVNHSTRKTFATTLLQSERPVTEVAQLGGWKSISTLTHYNIPSIKQQCKASEILTKMTTPERSNELDAVNLMNEPEHSFDTVIVNEPEHSFDTGPNDNNTDNINKELETVIEKENIPNPIFSQSSNMNSKMISTATRKESNPFSVLCGATITGGVINLNIYSGKRKYYELDSSQE